MKIFTAPGALDVAGLPLESLRGEWFGGEVAPPMKFAFGVDSEFFHFVARRRGVATVQPGALPGSFQTGLWHSDVTEFFLGDPAGDHYLEVNLAANGAWWACEFRGPRQPVDPAGCSIPGVTTEGIIGPDRWQAAIRIPVGFLRDRFSFGPASRLDATFIIESPAQRFLCASTPSPGDPDFHRPDAWPAVEMVPLGGAT